MNEIETGKRCSSHESCGRDGMCVFPSTQSIYGICYNILSMSDSTVVLPVNSSDSTGSSYVYQNDFEKLCRTGYLNVTTGRCQTGLKSKNKVGIYTCYTNRESNALQIQIVRPRTHRFLQSASAVTTRKDKNSVTSKEETMNGQRSLLM